MKPQPTNPRKGGRGTQRRKGKAMNYNMKTLDDFLHMHVIIKGLKRIGYVWGGFPTEGVDTPDILYVTIDGQEYEINTTAVEPVFLDSNTREVQSFEQTSGEDAKEAS